MRAAGLFHAIMKEWRGRLDGRGLIVGAEAARAEVDALHLAVNHDPRRVDVGRPGAVGMTLGMAHVMPEHRGLPAKIALHYSDSSVSQGKYCKNLLFHSTIQH